MWLEIASKIMVTPLKREQGLSEPPFQGDLQMERILVASRWPQNTGSHDAARVSTHRTKTPHCPAPPSLWLFLN